MKDRTSWTSQEDSLLVEQVRLQGHDWPRAALALGNVCGSLRSAKQCRERYVNYLDSSLVKHPFTREEDELIFKQHELLGNRWKKIAQFLPGRSDNSIKNQFYSKLRKGLRRLAKLAGAQVSAPALKVLKPKIISTLLHSASAQPHFLVFRDLVKKISLEGQEEQQCATPLPAIEKKDFEHLVAVFTILNREHLRAKEEKSVKREQRTKRRYVRRPKQEERATSDQFSSQLQSMLKAGFFSMQQLDAEAGLGTQEAAVSWVQVYPLLQAKDQPIFNFPQISL